jgi:uncharacterized protein (DUF2141 family)
LTIEIQGLESDTGQVRIAVLESEVSWLQTQVYARSLEIKNRHCRWSIAEVPYGDYAVAVFHGENGNVRNDRNFMGIPRESYGCSNDARGSFGPAKWRQARISLGYTTTGVQVRLE